MTPQRRPDTHTLVAWTVATALAASPALAQDTRQIATLKPPAQEALRKEMLDNLIALNTIVTLLATNQVKQAGELAEKELGNSATGKHAGQPFDARPGPQMPREMHQLGISGHLAATEFAKAAASGDRDKALRELSAVIGSCVASRLLPHALTPHIFSDLPAFVRHVVQFAVAD